MANCARCEFRADDLSEHAAESGHPVCIVCERRSLTEHERQACAKCVERVRDDLIAVKVAYEDLAHQATGKGKVRPDMLAILGDGSTQGGGPDDHASYHDPCSAAAELERIDRDWREEFGHERPTYPVLGSGKWQSRRPAFVFAEAYDYLETWHMLAARTHPGFDDFAAEIRELRSKLEHVAGLADDPRRDPVPCACGGKLVQDYTGGTLDPVGKRGLDDDRRCRDCGTIYRPDEYAFHLRLLTDTPGWVSPDQAARLIDRPVVTVKAWVARLDLPAVCNRLTKRLLVDAEAARVLAEERPARKRAG